ncbi:MAG: sulfotransferase [Alphaproteobacteria bacterium]|nr:sulfotransferase [Alphaproteobacteria bacterium]
MQSHADSPCIFIGGRRRTGTTMVHGLICKSDDTIELTRECTYLWQLMHAYGVSNALFDDHVSDYFESREEFTAFHREAVDRYLGHVAARFGPERRIVQKAPRLTPHFEDLAGLCPNAKFLVMIRDPRDTVASQWGRWHRINKRLNIVDELQRFVGLYKSLNQSRQVLGGGRLLFVRYEGLVVSPRETLGEIAKFLDISPPATDDDLSWPVKRPPADPSSTELDGQPPSRSRVGAYKGILKKDILDAIERNRAVIAKETGIDCFAADEPENKERFANTWPLAAPN